MCRFCAAPGGKALQVAERLQGTGLLLANDISSSRARVLVRNLEHFAYPNTFVSTIDPVRDAPAAWFEYFDCVQLDVPCSGEGMFRRDPQAVKSWEDFGPSSITAIQEKLLDIAAQVTKVGGTIAYSTCTFNLEENEKQISAFLYRNPAFRVRKLPENLRSAKGISGGLVGEGIDPSLSDAVRIWPHLADGDGHFCVLLEKIESSVNQMPKAANATFALVDREINKRKSKKGKKGKNSSAEKKKDNYPTMTEAKAAWEAFLQENIKEEYHSQLLSKTLRLHQKYLYLMDEELDGMEDVRLLKSGCFIGELKEQKSQYILQVQHSFFLEQEAYIWKEQIDFTWQDIRVFQVLQAQTILLEDEEVNLLESESEREENKVRYIAMTVDGHALALGKRNNSRIKNLFPANWVR